MISMGCAGRMDHGRRAAPARPGGRAGTVMWHGLRMRNNLTVAGGTAVLPAFSTERWTALLAFTIRAVKRPEARRTSRNGNDERSPRDNVVRSTIARGTSVSI